MNDEVLKGVSIAEAIQSWEEADDSGADPVSSAAAAAVLISQAADVPLPRAHSLIHAVL